MHRMKLVKHLRLSILLSSPLVIKGSEWKMAEGKRPLCAFGVIADVHYADAEDGMNFSRTVHRYYRRSLDLVKRAVHDWTSSQFRAAFVLQLGDLIDGQNSALGTSDLALNTATSELMKCDGFVYHVIGNHDLYNFSHSELLSSPFLKSSFVNKDGISTPSPGVTAYYHFSPAPGYRIVVIDTYEVTMLGHKEDSDIYRCAKAILVEHNKNEELNSPVGLKGLMRRFVKFNGGVSSKQLAWLEAVLQKSDEDNEIVIVAGHVPVFHGSTDTICLVWNYEDLVRIFKRHCCVLAYFAGHTHNYAYSRDENGIHHVTFPGVIEALPSCPAAHASVLVYPDSVVIKASEGGEMSDIVMSTSRSSL